MDEKVYKFFVSFYYRNTQLGGFNCGHCVIDATEGKITPGFIENVSAHLKEMYKNDTIIINIILLEED